MTVILADRDRNPDRKTDRPKELKTDKERDGR